MLLKVSDGMDGWVIFDKVENVHYRPVNKGIREAKDLDDLEVPNGMQKVNLVSKECFPITNGHNIEIGSLEFERNEKFFAAIYTNVAYICNDSGDTIERVLANRNKRS